MMNTQSNPVTITIDGEPHTIPEARIAFGIPDGECFGCYLGDDGPSAHDRCYLGEVTL